MFGHRLREAGLLGSMGRVTSSVDNTVIDSFWSMMQRELLDTRDRTNPIQLSSSVFEWIEAWCNPRRRHASIDDLSLAAFRVTPQACHYRGMISTPFVSGEPGEAPPAVEAGLARNPRITPHFTPTSGSQFSMAEIFFGIITA